jgi:hypothetical protein
MGEQGDVQERTLSHELTIHGAKSIILYDKDPKHDEKWAHYWSQIPYEEDPADKKQAQKELAKKTRKRKHKHDERKGKIR